MPQFSPVVIFFIQIPLKGWVVGAIFRRFPYTVLNTSSKSAIWVESFWHCSKQPNLDFSRSSSRKEQLIFEASRICLPEFWAPGKCTERGGTHSFHPWENTTGISFLVAAGMPGPKRARSLWEKCCYCEKNAAIFPSNQQLNSQSNKLLRGQSTSAQEAGTHRGFPSQLSSNEIMTLPNLTTEQDWDFYKKKAVNFKSPHLMAKIHDRHDSTEEKNWGGWIKRNIYK